MKFFNVLVFVCLFFFLIGCEDSPQRLIPIDEPDDGNSEITDDSDNPDTTPDPADSDNPDTTPDPADSDNPDTTPDPADSDNPDTTPDPADSDNPDTTPDPTDPTNPDPTNPDPTDPTNPDPTDPTGDTCYSAVFNGTDSKIEVAHNDALNLDEDAWTIEAWIKQPVKDVSDEIPIVGKKGSGSKFTYSLSHYYTTKTSSWGQQTTTAMKGSVTYSMMMSSEVSAEATGLTNSGDWTHIALVQTMSGTMMMKKPKVTLFINGKSVESKESNVTSNSISISTSTANLLIGSTGSKSFEGSIDSIRISNTARYSNTFTPTVLEADSNTIAFWDFTNNAKDAANGLNGTATNVTYENDCKK